MTFAEFTANTRVADPPLPSPSPKALGLLTAHLRTSKLIQNEQQPMEIASALHRQLSKIHEVLMSESNADLNIRRLSLQNLMLSYQAVLTISLLGQANGETT
jgi:hypothetical protein